MPSKNDWDFLHESNQSNTFFFSQHLHPKRLNCPHFVLKYAIINAKVVLIVRYMARQKLSLWNVFLGYLQWNQAKLCPYACPWDVSARITDRKVTWWRRGIRNFNEGDVEQEDCNKINHATPEQQLQLSTEVHAA